MHPVIRESRTRIVSLTMSSTVNKDNCPSSQMGVGNVGVLTPNESESLTSGNGSRASTSQGVTSRPLATSRQTDHNAYVLTVNEPRKTIQRQTAFHGTKRNNKLRNIFNALEPVDEARLKFGFRRPLEQPIAVTSSSVAHLNDPVSWINIWDQQARKYGIHVKIVDRHNYILEEDYFSHDFYMEYCIVTSTGHQFSCLGVGPSKKVAKRYAAEGIKPLLMDLTENNWVCDESCEACAESASNIPADPCVPNRRQRQMAGVFDLLSSGADMLLPGAGSVLRTGKSLISGVESLFRGGGAKNRSKSNQDQPTVPQNFSKIQLTQNQQLSLGQQSLDINTLRLDKTNLTPHPPGIFPHSFTNVKEIQAVEGQIQYFTISDTLAIGESFCVIQPKPVDGIYIAGADLGTWLPDGYLDRVPIGQYQPINLTPLSHVAMHFENWTGDLEYTFYFAMAQPQSFRFRISDIPDMTMDYYLSNKAEVDRLALAGAYKHVDVVVEEQHEFTYVRTFPFPLTMSRISDEEVEYRTPIIRGEPTTPQNRFAAHSIGLVICNALTPLRTTGVTADTIGVALTLKGPNVEFGPLVQSRIMEIPKARQELTFTKNFGKIELDVKDERRRQGDIETADAGGVSEVSVVSQAGNTADTEARGSSTDPTLPGPVLRTLDEKYLGLNAHISPDQTDRQILFKTLTVDTTMPAGKIIDRISLPFDILRAVRGTANWNAFNQYAYSKPRMHITVEINNPPFNGGYLVIAQRYFHSGEEFSSGEINSHNIVDTSQLLQMNHCKIDMSVVNNVQLSVPYQHFANLIPNAYSNVAPFYVSSLFVGILCPMNAAESNSNSATLQFKAELRDETENTAFYGQREWFEMWDGPYPTISRFIIPTRERQGDEERSENKTVISTEQSHSPVLSDVFGEDFSDAKTILRRPQLHSEVFIRGFYRTVVNEQETNGLTYPDYENLAPGAPMSSVPNAMDGFYLNNSQRFGIYTDNEPVFALDSKWGVKRDLDAFVVAQFPVNFSAVPDNLQNGYLSTTMYELGDWQMTNSNFQGTLKRAWKKESMHFRKIDLLSHMAQAFRFGRGTIRFYVEFWSNERVNLSVVHDPSNFPWTPPNRLYHKTVMTESEGINSYIGLPQNDSDSPESIKFNPVTYNVAVGHDRGYLIDDTNQGLAHEVAHAEYNGVTNFEVPFYQQSLALVNNLKSYELPYHHFVGHQNGVVRLFFRFPNGIAPTTNLRYRVWRAIGDDADLSVFQGFPLVPMVILDRGAVTRQSHNTDAFVKKEGEEETGRKRQLDEEVDFKDLNPIKIRLGETAPVEVDTHCKVVEEEISVCSLEEAVRNGWFKPNPNTTFVSEKGILYQYLAHVVAQPDTSDKFSKLKSIMKALAVLESKRYRERQMFASPSSGVSGVSSLSGLMGGISSSFSSLANSVTDPIRNVRQAAANMAEINPHNINATANDIGTAAQKVGAVADWLQNTLGQISAQWVDHKDDLAERSYNVISNFTNLFLTDNILIRINSFVGLLVNLKILKFSAVSQCVDFLRDWWGGGRQRQVGEDASESPILGWAKMIVPALFSIAGLSFCHNKNKMFIDHFKDYCIASNSFSQFVKNNLLTLKDLIKRITAKYFPGYNIEEMKTLLPEVHQWIQDVYQLVGGHTEELIMASTELKIKVTELHEKGIDYLGNISLEGRHLKPAILQAFKKLDDIRQRIGQRVGTGEPPRVPICIWTYGPPGIGKSYLNARWAKLFCQAVNRPTAGQLIYTRTTDKFWNGWDGRPVVLFDDAGAIKTEEHIQSFLADWFGLLTDQPYNVPMAEVSEKDRVANPVFVFVNSNFRDLSHLNKSIADMKAFNRRRDFLIEVRLADWFKQKYPGMEMIDTKTVPFEDLEEGKHLEFCLHKNPMMSHEPDKDGISQGVPAAEFEPFMVRQVKELYTRRTEAARRRARDLYGLPPEDMFDMPPAFKDILKRVRERERQGNQEEMQDYSFLTFTNGLGAESTASTSHSERLVRLVELVEKAEAPKVKAISEPGISRRRLAGEEEEVFVDATEDFHLSSISEAGISVWSDSDALQYFNGRRRDPLHPEEGVNVTDIGLDWITTKPYVKGDCFHAGLINRFIIQPPEHMLQTISGNGFIFVWNEGRPWTINVSNKCCDTCALSTYDEHEKFFYNVLRLMWASYYPEDPKIPPALVNFENGRATALEMIKYKFEQGCLAMKEKLNRVAPTWWKILTEFVRVLCIVVAIVVSFTAIAGKVRRFDDIWYGQRADQAIGQSKLWKKLLKGQAEFSDDELRNLLKEDTRTTKALVAIFKECGNDVEKFHDLLGERLPKIRQLSGSGDPKTSKKAATRITLPNSRVRQLVADGDKLLHVTKNVFSTCTFGYNMKGLGIKGVKALMPYHIFEAVRKGNWQRQVHEYQFDTKENMDFFINKFKYVSDEGINERSTHFLYLTCSQPSLARYFKCTPYYGNVDDDKLCVVKKCKTVWKLVESDEKAAKEPWVRMKRLESNLRPTNWIEFPLSMLDVKRLDSYDLAVVSFPPSRCPSFKDISGCFLDSDKVPILGGSYTVVDYDFKLGTPIQVMLKSARYASYADPDPDFGDYQFDGWDYDFQRFGACGSVLINDNTGLICGLHVAGNPATNVGSATACNKELWSGLVNLTQEVEEEEVKIGEGDGDLELPDGFIPIGRVRQKEVVHINNRSAINRSMAFGIFPNVREPAILSHKGEKRPGYGPLAVGVKKQLDTPLPFNPILLRRAIDFLKVEISAKAIPVKQPVQCQSLQDTVCGIPGVEFHDPVDLTTSSGFPYCATFNGASKKRFILVKDGKLQGLHPEFAKDFEEARNARRNGIIPFRPYFDFLKDERLKPGKATRLINGSAMCTTLDFKAYLGCFLSALRSARHQIGIMVGLNTHGPEWTRLATDLLKKGDKILCGDYSSFGPTLMPECVLGALEIVNSWYDHHCGVDEEANMVRRTLFLDLLFCKHVAGDTMYRTLTGSPSGAAITAEMNSIVNMLYMLVSWQHITGMDCAEMDSFVCGRFYGDDVIMSVSDLIIDVFNNVEIERFLRRHNITYTDITKTGEMLPYRSLKEASFLKCYFRKHPTRVGMYLGSLDEQVSREIAMWVRCKPSDTAKYREASLEASYQCVQAAYGLGLRTFGEVCRSLKEFWLGRGEAFHPKEWSQYDEMFMEKGAWLGAVIPGSTSYLEELVQRAAYQTNETVSIRPVLTSTQVDNSNERDTSEQSSSAVLGNLERALEIVKVFMEPSDTCDEWSDNDSTMIQGPVA